MKSVGWKKKILQRFEIGFLNGGEEGQEAQGRLETALGADFAEPYLAEFSV